MDVFALQNDGSEQLLASGLDARDVVELQERWRYTKPFGLGVKVVVRADLQPIASFSTTGTEPGVAAEVRHSEIFIG